jgi:cell division protein FtsB
MKLSSFLLTPIIAVIVYVIVKNLNLGTGSSNALITVLFTALFTAMLYISQSGRSEGSLKSQIDSLKDEKSDLKQKISKLEEENTVLKSQKAKQPLQFDKRLHCYKDEGGHLYCPPCYDDKDKSIHLKPAANPNEGWICPACHNFVGNPDYTPPPLPPYGVTD